MSRDVSRKINKPIWLLVFLLPAVLVALVVYSSRPREPVYRGRRLTTWLRDLNANDATVNAEAKAALRQMGSNAVPTLLEMFCAPHDSNFKHEVLVLSRKQFPVHLPLLSSAERKDLGWRGLLTVGPDALRPFVRTLAEDLQAGRAEVAGLLAMTGTEGLPPLLAALTNRNAEVQCAAANALSTFGRIRKGDKVFSLDTFYSETDLRKLAATYADAAVPALITRLTDNDKTVRRSALRALQEIGEKPELLVPIAIDKLTASDPANRFYAIRILAEFPDQALPAIPKVVKALDDDDKAVREAATNALNKIAPKPWVAP
jgi:HEAT repeat protein